MTDSQDQPSPTSESHLPETVSEPPSSAPSSLAETAPASSFVSLLLTPLLFLTLLVTLGATLYALCFLPNNLDAKKTLVIARGTNVQEIGRLLEDNHIVANAFLFKILSHFLAANGLHAGEYQFTPEQSMADMIEMMRDGKSIIRRFTVPEGLTTGEIIEMLKNEPSFGGTLTLKPEEGSLWPETYHYSFGDSRNGMIERMQKAAREELQTLWKERAPDLPVTSVQEALVMASLIEKETGKKAEERPKVAGVFYNRLKTGMKLQSDPTVIYAITKGMSPLARSLTHQDLETPSPFNTYFAAGLPPKPICNPGAASIRAALHPEAHDFLYFVADGTGGHAFAKDLPTHNKNVTNWINGLRGSENERK